MFDDKRPLAALTRKLGSLAPLDDLDRQALHSLPVTIEPVKSGRYLVREGGEPTDCCLLLSGYACRNKVTVPGARQIVSFHIAGDILDLQHLHFAVADHHVQAITRAQVAWIPKAKLRALARQRPAVAEALWRDTLIDASIFREWVLNVGRRDAITRVSHMLCEFATRCEAAGLGPADRFEWPLTQEHIADATGLTPVHINRTLKELSLKGCISSHRGRYRIEDWAMLKNIGEFDRAYLHAAAAAA
jgi:CRP-like cAMP-binding protein